MNLKMGRHIILSGFLILTVFFSSTFAQQKKEEKVRISPMASVMQVVGFTKVTIVYSRPGVKGRKIWDGLVPYNKVWRAGANEATTIEFSTDVTIEGNKLPAGKYGFFAIPSDKEWTLVFNKVWDQWGAFEYNEAEDILRIKVKPEKGNFHEWLTYTITKTGDDSATIALEWDNLKVPFKIKVPIKK